MFSETTSAIQNWEWGATMLPLLIGLLMRKGLSKSRQAQVAMAVYAVYGLLGAWLAGEFEGLAWNTLEQVVTSILAVATIGFAAYKTLWLAVPLPALIEANTGGDPLVTEVPLANAA